MDRKKRIALVAHDAKKRDMLEWAAHNEKVLARHELWATGTTGALVAEHCPSLNITRLKSGPLGGDQQLGSMIANGALDVLVFFTDPLTSLPHDVDVKALLRLCTVYNVVIACNRATADFVITSPCFSDTYQPSVWAIQEQAPQHIAS